MDKTNIAVNPVFHSLIPPLAPEELAQLEHNLLTDGCRDPLATWRGTLLDGHNRFDICQRHNLPFQTVEIELTDNEAAMDWIDANQLGRRNLTPDQRSIIRGRLYNRTKKAAADNLKRGSSYRCPHCHTIYKNNEHICEHSASGQNVRSERTSETLAVQHHVTERTIRRDGKRAEALDQLAETQPELAQAVRDGKKRFNEVRREIKRAEVQQTVKLPDAKFRVVYADPPWKYGDQLTEDYGPTKFHYPSMSIPELCALPIRELVESDAVLFLWVTSPLLFQCAPIISAWGFSYKTSFVWDKIKHNMGHYNSVRHEFLLICTRGSCQPDVPTLYDSVQSIERTRHSVKPPEFRALIDALYPHGKRVELFARGEVPSGWESWGNQA